MFDEISPLLSAMVGNLHWYTEVDTFTPSSGRGLGNIPQCWNVISINRLITIHGSQRELQNRVNRNVFRLGLRGGTIKQIMKANRNAGRLFSCPEPEINIMLGPTSGVCDLYRYCPRQLSARPQLTWPDHHLPSTTAATFHLSTPSTAQFEPKISRENTDWLEYWVAWSNRVITQEVAHCYIVALSDESC